MKNRAVGKVKVDVEELEPVEVAETVEATPERQMEPAAATPKAPIAPELQRVQLSEQKTIAQILEDIGPRGSYQIRVSRDYPETWPDATGKPVKVNGMLRVYDEPVDESFISERHGGGKFAIKVMRNDKGSWRFAAQRTIEIAGDPKLDGLNRTLPVVPQASAAPAVPAESPTLIKHAFDLVSDQLAEARADLRQRAATPPPAPTGVDPAMRLLLEQMTAQLASRDAELAEMRREIAAARNVKPPEDPLKDKLLGNLLDGQSGHVEALRLRHEAELRQIKESAHQDIQRLQDRFDRDRQFMEASHAREMDANKHSHEVAMSSQKASFEMQVTVLKGDVGRLERECASQRDEIKELRGRKDKTIIETLTEMNKIKEAFGADEGGEKSGLDKIVEVMSSPAAMEAVQGIFAKKQNAQAQAAAPAVVAQSRPQIMKDAQGNTFAVVNKGGVPSITPVTRKPKQIQTETGAVIEAPVVDPAVITQIISYLETAFRNQTAPDAVAMSARPMIPGQILDWIRQNHTEQVNGVDLFMRSVAKLPGTSPLATQLGKNWLRKVGAALIE